MNTQGTSIPKPCPKVELLDMQTNEFCIPTCSSTKISQIITLVDK